MTDSELFNEELDRLSKLYGAKVFTKDLKWRRLWDVIQVLYTIITFGKVRDWKKRFTITIGAYVFFPSGWKIEEVDGGDYEVLRHEGDGHMRQCFDLGRGSVWRGLPIFLLLYAFMFFPIGLAWFRYKFEREAYVISFYAAKEVGRKFSIDFAVDALTGPSYLWAWPFKKSVRKYFEENCK